MKKFRITFSANKLGSLGKTVTQTETVLAKRRELARIPLYDRYEHIKILRIREVEDKQTHIDIKSN